MSSCNISDYLKNGLVVNIFYLQRKNELKRQLLSYLENGTRSLLRKHINPRGQKNEICICEYQVYKMLVFLDCIRGTKYYGVLASMWGLPLLDYLVDMALLPCTMDCVRYSEIDFTTHYIKRVMTSRFTSVKPYGDNRYKIVEKAEYPYIPITKIVGKSNGCISSMMLLDFNCVYRVVALKKIRCISSYRYVITLFKYVENYDYLLICDFYLPRACLSEIIGSKDVDQRSGFMDIARDQYIHVVDTRLVNKKREVVIKAFVEKTFKQLG